MSVSLADLCNETSQLCTITELNVLLNYERFPAGQPVATRFVGR